MQPISVSVVSHRQGGLVQRLLADLAEHCGSSIEVVLTLNLPEDLPFDPAAFPYPLELLRNATPKGFGANHNAAFRAASGEFFCVLNPDVRLRANPFPTLVERLRDPAVGVVAPLIRNTGGAIENSARRLPTPLSILRKALIGPPGLEYPIGATDLDPDWLAGMFLLFRRETFAAIGGFDERYHLYYEDVDLCTRLALAGQHAVLCAEVEAVHDAQRSSHRDPRYLRWHLASMLRFFASAPFRTFLWRRVTRAHRGRRDLRGY